MMHANLKPLDLTSSTSAQQQQHHIGESVQAVDATNHSANTDAAKQRSGLHLDAHPSSTGGRAQQHHARGGRRGGRSGRSGRGYRQHLSKQDRTYLAHMAAQQM